MITTPTRTHYQRGDVVMTDNLATIATMEIGRRIGSIDMTIVDEALRYTLDLPLK